MTTDARSAVLRQLERAYERHAVAEQVYQTTEPQKASDAHDAAVYLIRWIDIEDRDPKPKPPCGCLECSAIYAAGGGE
jgi:hypothetical protein